jgi:hypothetical protein
MKHLRMSLSAIAVLAIVGSALAFTGKYNTRNVFCAASGTITGTCPASDVVNFKVDVNGTITNPCTGTLVPHIQSTNCVNAPTGTLYSAANPE